jgi:hypothetical protein
MKVQAEFIIQDGGESGEELEIQIEQPIGAEAFLNRWYG